MLNSMGRNCTEADWENKEQIIMDEKEKEQFFIMNEKIYRTISATGVGDIVVGILVITVGLAAGVIAIVNGARLLSSRKNVLL